MDTYFISGSDVDETAVEWSRSEAAAVQKSFIPSGRCTFKRRDRVRFHQGCMRLCRLVQRRPSPGQRSSYIILCLRLKSTPDYSSAPRTSASAMFAPLPAALLLQLTI